MKLPLAKIETIKSWGVSTYKCTRQLMYEKLGKTARTVDKGMNLSMFSSQSVSVIAAIVLISILQI